MSTESWIVKTLGGDEWGFVKRLIISSVTCQISHADVIVAATGRLIRLPWENFDVRTEGIKLRIPEGQAQVGGRKPSEAKLGDTVSMELWP